jgi:hypothetical protein
MKNVILCFFILITSTSFAADRDMTAVDGVNYFPNNKVNQPVQETSVTYFRLGRSITTESDQNSTSLMGSLGHLRYADWLAYGLDYTYHNDPDGMRFHEYDIMIGYRATSKFRVVPYVLGGAGLSFSQDSSGQNRDGGSGINYFLDAGVELFTVDVKDFNIKIMAGLKLTHETLTGGYEPTRNFEDAYLGIGLGF